MVKNYINNNEQESGRSMVEMLGVLAIIGVLSVGGISGYTTAMNKHKANEILNAAAVRAMVVSTQLQSGVTDPTLAEFPTGEEVGGAKFGDVSKVGDSQFKIGFTTQPTPAVVEQMKNIAGDNVGVDGSRLLYNNDLSSPVTNTNNRDENDPTKCAVGYVLPDCDTCAEGYEKQSDGTCAEPVAACPDTATTTQVSNSLAFDYEGAICYCPVTDGHAFYSEGKNKCVEYKMVRSNLTHPEAHNACKNGWTIASKTNDIEKDFSTARDDEANEDNYSADLTRKIGWYGSSYFLWLKECESGCPENLTDTTKTFGSAWLLNLTGNTVSYVRTGDEYDDYFALCVR